MKKYTIFLASSAELDEDKKIFENFISAKNKEWHDKKVFLELLTWKDFVVSMSENRTQDEYNKAIAKADLFVILFHTKVGKYTSEEFNVAYDQFIKSKRKRPLIFTYFKDGGEQNADINAFKERLDGLGHFYALYDNYDDLNYKFDRQLDKLAAEKVIKWDTFDWKRSMKYLVFAFLLPILALVFIYRYQQLSKPFDLTVMVNETRAIPDLPFEKGSLTLSYGEKQETIEVRKEAYFKELPSSLRGEEANLKFTSFGYQTVDTTFDLNDKAILLPIKRDNTLGEVLGTIKDEYNRPIEGVEVRILDVAQRTDDNGRFHLIIPLDKQKKTQRISASKKGYIGYDRLSPVFKDVEMNIILRK